MTTECAAVEGDILHEICHALGLWHEQSRPDRNNYVTIHWENIEDGEESNFRIKKEKEVDYQGTGYDYGSIMHYGTGAFNNCPNCETITVNNNEEYVRQGRPFIGQSEGLSPIDIIQIKRLYKCPGPGERGVFVIYIRNGVRLEDTDPIAGDPDPYVKVKAIDSNGQEFIRRTSIKYGTDYPTWNENLVFDDRGWQFFRISVWDRDIFIDDPMGMSVTVPLPDQHNEGRVQSYCTNTACNRYILYEYDFLPVISGRLRVKVRYARNLPDTDPIWNDPDPYVCVGVTSPTGSIRYQYSNVKSGTRNPTWNTWISLSLSQRSFSNRITVQVFDDDVTHDDAMSNNPESFDISSGYHSRIRHCVANSCRAFLIFDYEVLPNKYERRLQIYARYGKNLPDRDGWGAGDSDPYLQVVAYDINGYSSPKTTSTDRGDENPEWYQTLDFGVGMWTTFKVSVWDSNIGPDDRLSITHTRSLPSTDTISRSGVRLCCYSGYVVINYTFR